MKTLTTAATAAALTAALTGCAAGAGGGPAAAPVTTSMTATAAVGTESSDRVIDGVWVGDDPTPLPGVADGGADLDTAARLGMDRARAANAAKHGYPYVTVVNGDGEGCPIILRLPDGALWWAPPMVTITGAGTAMTALPADAAAVPAGCVTPSGPPAGGPVDTAAMAAALDAGRPWISADGGDDVDGCHVQIHLPDGESLGLDSQDAGEPGGVLVGGMSRMFACSWR